MMAPVFKSTINIDTVIAFHNQRVIKSTFNNRGGNYKNKFEWLLDVKCWLANFAYKTVVAAPTKPDTTYISALQKLYFKTFSEKTKEIKNEKLFKYI